ncbi:MULTISPECIES: hypothetical protein [Tatumella]|uniref:Uncharacterized protein n=1 Tax=Tatumella punctata TaxID=399969 RepID=A0ABW1VM82_9GAMM|nr:MULTISPECIES: hypothetical protein [unclassified Tatumella]MBS0855055.1 hypothetical protein [Tatumella sp. JGM16]MBS0892671.1 hypothetical protein [Tatumella sp. JGM130]MBS0911950.1 hypothetical protein [Tatumella sp. JGM91]
MDKTQAVQVVVCVASTGSVTRTAETVYGVADKQSTGIYPQLSKGKSCGGQKKSPSAGWRGFGI